MVPWSRYIDINNGIPTKDNFPGTGLFEGANYHETSVYRPSMNSLMRFLQPGVFNVPSRLRLEEAINPFLHGLSGRLALRMPRTGCGYAAKIDLSWDTTDRSEEHTSELQSLMRISYAVFCLKKK